MDIRQLLGLLLVIAGVSWLLIGGRASVEDRSKGLAATAESDEPFARQLKAVAEKLPNRYLLGVILVILGALLIVPWNNVFGSDSSAPCCPPGALSGSAIVDTF